MKGNKTFNSTVKELNSFAESIPNSLISMEPMFFNSDINFAYENGGEITKDFIDALPGNWKKENLIFSSRSHMLMPNWYPAIPGFHHDDVPRPNGGQPDYDTTEYYSEHIMGLVNASIAPTEFALGQCTLTEVPEDVVVYRQWHNEVEDLLSKGLLERYVAPDRTLLWFDWQSLHQAVIANRSDWRWFGRVTKGNTKDKPKNEIRKQVQIYMQNPTQGW